VVSPLPDLRERLLALHKLLLDDETRAWQAQHGREVSGQALFRLLLEDPQFAWLRALSGLVSRIDAALDEPDDAAPAATQERAFLEETLGLLRSEGHGPFETKYRDALQRSPEIVMAHAAVIKLLPLPRRG
jgi:hypothetical protein